MTRKEKKDDFKENERTEKCKKTNQTIKNKNENKLKREANVKFKERKNLKREKNNTLAVNQTQREQGYCSAKSGFLHGQTKVFARPGF